MELILLIVVTIFIVCIYFTTRQISKHQKDIDSRLDDINNAITDIKYNEINRSRAEKRNTATDSLSTITDSHSVVMSPSSKAEIDDDISSTSQSVIAESDDIQSTNIVTENITSDAEEVIVPLILTKAEDSTTQKVVDTDEHKVSKNKNYEKYIGENLFGKIGILILIVGVGLFVKYAINNDWINETIRCVLGFAIGAAILVVAHFLKKNKAFSSLLAGGALAIFYITIAISYHYYELFSHPVAFVLLVVVTLFTVALSLLYDRKELGITSLVGGFIAPFIVAHDEGSIISLLIYIVLLNVGMLILALYKKWAELPLMSFVATNLILLYVINVVVKEQPLAVYTLLFLVLFYLIFIVSALSVYRSSISDRMSKLYITMLGLTNLTYLAMIVGVLNIMDLSIRVQGLAPISLALANVIILYWSKQVSDESRFKMLKYATLGSVLTLVTITVPVQLSGNYITIAWAAEVAVLLFLYAKSQYKLYNHAALVLFVLTVISEVFNMNLGRSVDLLSAGLTHVGIGIASLTVAYILHRYKDKFNSKDNILIYYPFNSITILLAVVVFYIAVCDFAGYYNLPQDRLLTMSDVENYSHVSESLLTSLYMLLVICLLPLRFKFIDHVKKYYLCLGLYIITTYVYILFSESLTTVLVLMAATIAAYSYILRLFVKTRTLTKSHHKYSAIYLSLLLYALPTLYAIELLSTSMLPGDMAPTWVFSISISVVAIVLIIIGVRKCIKQVRIIGMCGFGVVILKLAVVDLWIMSSGGKIATFIFLGVVFLSLSFMYQKLKNTIFKDEE